jgi:dTDP-4-amino-4,6-dideoxygalactose transaminase
MPIQMVDLKSQYLKIKDEIDFALINCVEATRYIKGPEVKQFEENLAKYFGVNHVISCGNGTDALQIALMALDLQPGDEVIVPAFTYVATAEAIALLKLTPVMVDVDPETFNINVNQIEQAITPKTKAIVPVHLYGQTANMEPIMKLAEKHGLYVIEDNAQALGAETIFSDGTVKKTGTIGHIGCNSFFPTKNLNNTNWLILPHKASYANHSFNQFTLTVKNGKRDALQEHLKQKGIPTIIYYPLPLYKQPAFQQYNPADFKLENTEMLCNAVLSIPMHTELTTEIQDKVIAALRTFLII